MRDFRSPKVSEKRHTENNRTGFSSQLSKGTLYLSPKNAQKLRFPAFLEFRFESFFTFLRNKKDIFCNFAYGFEP